MAREMTPQERAAELCFKLALLVDADTHMEVDQDAMKAITEALTATRRAALLEIADYAKRECCVQCADTDRWQKGHNVAALHIASVCEAKIRELGS